MTYGAKHVARQLEEGWWLSCPSLWSMSEESWTGAPCSQDGMEKVLDHRQGGNGRALGKKATVGDLIPGVSILINTPIEFMTDRIRNYASILHLCLDFSLFFFPDALGSHPEDLINVRFNFLMLFHFLDGGPATRRPDLKL